MKRILFGFAALLCSTMVPAQKKPIEIDMTGKWRLGRADAHISNDGRFVIVAQQGKLSLQSSDGALNRELPNAAGANFTDDSQKVIYSTNDQKLEVLDVAQDKVQEISDKAASFQTKSINGEQWLAYQESSGDKRTVLLDLANGEQAAYPQSSLCQLHEKGLLIQTQPTEKTDSLIWVSLPDRKQHAVVTATGKNSGITFDDRDTEMAFMVTEDKAKRIMVYKLGADEAVLRVDDKTPGIDPGLEMSDYGMEFSYDGKRLFLRLQYAPVPKPTKDPDAVSVDVWSYKDHLLQSHQLKHPIEYRSFLCVSNGDNEPVVQLHTKDDMSISDIPIRGSADFVIANRDVDIWEYWWNDTYEAKLISTDKGAESGPVATFHTLPGRAHMSPTGRYVIYFDFDKETFFCYNIAAGTTKNITKDIPYPVYVEDEDYTEPKAPYSHHFYWTDNDSSVLIYDQFDLWQLDPDGVKPPVNLTNGYGRKNHIRLRYISTTDEPPSRSEAAVLHTGDTLTLAAFDVANKDTGLFRLKLGVPADPEKLTMGPYIYDLDLNPDLQTQHPVKARDAEMYLVFRMSANQPYQPYLSSDLKSFKPLAVGEPQKDYKWYTTELLHWKMYDGKMGEGILYKPEDFDPKKKYPIIFTFYERDSENLNNFIEPGLSVTTLHDQIPYYLSHGYLVFDPNIYFKKGKVGECAYNSIGSAGDYLSRMPWVDASKMGLQGMSFGAYEVNYVITRTNKFAAAVEASGDVNFPSQYGSLSDDDFSEHFIFERTQYHEGASLWQDPKGYIDNSPIFRADKVETPLLIVHNKKDPVVQFTQAIEWFTGLRRLHKKVWMLQYDNGSHGIQYAPEQKDFSIRMAQFFDYYLMNGAAPRWMTEGIPARLKQIDRGLDPDRSGKVP